MILYDGGYKYNRLRSDKLILNNTNTKDKSFKILNKNISFYGLHINLNDYDYRNISKIKLNNKFSNDLFEDIFACVMSILTNFDKYINNCEKKLPWEIDEFSYGSGIKQIYEKQFDFYINAKNKYLQIYPKAKELLIYVENNINKKTFIIETYVQNNKNESYFWNVMDRIVYEFQILFPKLHSEYFKWCTYYSSNKNYIDILLINNINDLIKYFINKL